MAGNAAGCGSGARVELRETHDDLVRRVRFEGNGGFWSGHDNFQLRAQMEQDSSPAFVTWFPLNHVLTPEGLDLDSLDRDSWRLEVWYAHNGWFDARFLGWEVVRIHPRHRRRVGVVDLWGHVAPGELSVVRRLSVAGLDQPKFMGFRNTLLRTALVQEGGQFSLDSVRGTREQLMDLLDEHGFPYVKVEPRVDAYPDEHVVDVQLEVDPGPFATFGPIVVQGTDKVKESVVRDTLTFEEGDRWDSAELSRSQSRLFSLRTFGLANVTPDLSDPTQTEVPMTVTVKETDFRTLRFGGGVEYEGTTFTPRLSVNFAHVHLLHRLIRLDAGAEIGAAFSPGRATPRDIFGANLGISTPRLFSRHFGLAAEASIERDLRAGQFEYQELVGKIAWTYTPSDFTALKLGPSWKIYELLGFEAEGEYFARVIFGEGFRPGVPYRLNTVDLSLSVDWRDDPIFTRRGAYHFFSIRQALPYKSSDYLYTELAADVRTYKPLRLRRRTDRVPLSVHARLHGRMLLAWDDRGLPYPERGFLGGSTSLRGFRADQVGPDDQLCLYRPSDEGDPFSQQPGAGDPKVSRRYFARGGNVAIAGSTEVRYDFKWIIGAAFLDAGLLLDDRERGTIAVDRLGFDAIRWGTGVGIRYPTSVGPIRLDIAVRPLFEDGPITAGSAAGPADSIGCSADDVRPQPFDLFWTARRAVDRDHSTERKVPFALNIYLAIGEAF